METDNIQSLEMVEVLSNEYKHQIFFFFLLNGTNHNFLYHFII